MNNRHRMSVEALRATARHPGAQDMGTSTPESISFCPDEEERALLAKNLGASITGKIPGTPENWGEDGPLGNDPAHVQVYGGPYDDVEIDRALDLVSVSFRVPRKTWEEFQIKLRTLPIPTHEAVVLRAMVTLFNKNPQI